MGTVAGEAEVVANLDSELGEGPLWDPRIGRIVWVDIRGDLVHQTDPATGSTDSFATPGTIGAIVRRGSGGYVAALHDGFWTWDGTASADAWQKLVGVEDDRPEMRFNDGKVDPAGRFWAGTMGVVYQEQPWKGSLYRLDADHRVTRTVDGVWISNGLAWSVDASTMYYIDTKRSRVDAFRYDVGSGEIGDRRTWVEIPPQLGSPDGMAIDVEGGLWVAVWGGWAVQRYVDGRLDRVVRLPVAEASSCAFGGPDLDVLYITTARDELNEEERRAQPLAGSLFRADPGVRGAAIPEYAG